MKKETRNALIIASAAAVAASVAVTAAVAVRNKKREQAPEAAVELPPAIEFDEDNTETVRRAARREQTAQWMKTAALGALSFLLTLLTQGATLFFTSLFAKIAGSPITALLGFLGDVLVNFVLMALLLALLFKRLYPERSLKELFTFKNILWMAAGSILLSLVKVVVFALLPDAFLWNLVIRCLATIGILVFIWCRVFRLEGRAAVLFKNALWSRRGLATLGVLTLSSLLAALVSYGIHSIALLSPLAGVVFTFIISAAVAWCFFRVLRPKKLQNTVAPAKKASPAL